MRWEPTFYFFSFGTLMASIVTTAVTPLCRKRAAGAKREPGAEEPRRSEVPCEKNPGRKDRVGLAMRQWTNERADTDLFFVTPPAPVIRIEVQAPEASPAPQRTPTVEFVHCSKADPAPEPESQEQSKSISEANPFLTADFHGAPNFYEILQISQRADLETIHRVYRIMAARFHPDNPVSGDHEMFLQLGQAYEVLSRPERRSLYDFALQAREKEPNPIFNARIFVDGLDGELNRRFGVLALLYQRRRTNQGSMGMSLLELENRMSLPREHLEFTMWYLRSKGHVQIQEENSDYAISSSGVDYVEANSTRNPILRELLSAGSAASPAEPVKTEVAARGRKRSRRQELHRGRRQGSIIL